MKPLPATVALDRYFLDARAKLLELAAILDRVERGAEAEQAQEDSRWGKLQQAIAVLSGHGTDRAERIQQIFSLPYDESWPRPTPR